MATDQEFNEMTALLDKTNKAKPDPADLDKLRVLLDKTPDLCNIAGNMALQAKVRVLDTAFGQQEGAKLSAVHHYARMRDELNYKDASAIERSLIEHICLCWLRLYCCEVRYELASHNATLAQGEFWEKKLSAHQRRYLRSVETLARVRRLMKPAPNPLTMMLVKQQIGR